MDRLEFVYFLHAHYTKSPSNTDPICVQTLHCKTNSVTSRWRKNKDRRQRIQEQRYEPYFCSGFGGTSRENHEDSCLRSMFFYRGNASVYSICGLQFMDIEANSWRGIPWKHMKIHASRETLLCQQSVYNPFCNSCIKLKQCFKMHCVWDGTHPPPSLLWTSIYKWIR